MRVVSITEVRQDATKVVEHTQRTREPVLVCVRSRPVAYIVKAEEYEAMQEELRRLRHDLFWQGVAEAEAEHRRGLSQPYENAQQLIEDLALES